MVVSRVNYTDGELCQRWRCTPMKLWRLRKAGKLHSIKIAGRGSWLTSDEEVERVESVPPQKPAPKGAVKERDAAYREWVSREAENEIVNRLGTTYSD